MQENEIFGHEVIMHNIYNVEIYRNMYYPIFELKIDNYITLPNNGYIAIIKSIITMKNYIRIECLYLKPH